MARLGRVAEAKPALTDWLKPPRTLLVLLYLLTLASVSTLGWFGWRLLEQERIVEAQRTHERLGQVADRVAAIVRGALAETGERLGAGLPPPEDGTLLLLSGKSLTAGRRGQLLYYPVPSNDPEAVPAVFFEAELIEFARSQPQDAIRVYERQAASTDRAIRAGALLRVARVLRKTDRAQQARKMYEQLAAMQDVRVAGAPADLVARHALCELAASAACANEIQEGLKRGLWTLTRGQFDFYWSEAARLTNSNEPPPPVAAAFSEAAAALWRERDTHPEPRGIRTVWAAGRPFVAVWRGTPQRRAVLLARPEILLKRAISDEGILYALVDNEGRALTGPKPSTPIAAVRTPDQTQLPWTLYVSAASPSSTAGIIPQQRFLVLGLSVMAVFLMLGTYFIARAIRREAAVQQMQAEFVSAVSHEFRSPLTSMRQLSELLTYDRVPSEERRQLYYETMLRETARLQRLIEALLNFGRMDAGARQYRFEPLDAAAVVKRVVSEFEPQVTAAGRRIEATGDGDGCPIEADPDAICVALRNLVDNALKYSPGQPAIWVEWGMEDGSVAIRVRDLGPGIDESERKAIFRKFVRGAAALSGNVKGSGVGLAMVRHIVAAHRGEISVISRPGYGSTFTMLLPALAEDRT